MKLLSLELVNYKRLKNKGITRISLNFDEVIQIFIGSNGSGKSSCLRECSPLPPENKEYHKGGMKKVVVEHNSKIYTLTSYLPSPSKHSFIVDDKECNEGGTYTVQKLLVEQYFRYTEEIHEFLLGKRHTDNFSTMLSSRRKEWIMKLYPHDLTYPTILFKELTSKLRGGNDAIKTLNNNLSAKYLDVNKTFNEDEVKNQIEDYKKRNKLLLEHYDNSIDYINYDKLIDERMGMIKSILTKMKPLAKYTYPSHSSIDDIKNKIRDFDNGIERIKQSNKNYMIELDTISKNTLFNQEMSSTDISMIENEIKELSQRIVIINDKMSNYLNIGNGEMINIINNYQGSVLDKYLSIIPEVVYFLSLIPTPLEGASIPIYQKAIKTDYDTKVKIDSLTRLKENLEHKLSHAELVSCPKCDYKWAIGYKDDFLEVNKKKLEETNQQLIESTTLLAKVHNYMSIHEDWHTAITNYLSFIEPYYQYNEIWDYLSQTLYTQNGIYMSNQLTSSREYFLDKLMSDKLTNDKQLLSNKLKMISDDSFKWYQNRYKELEVLISDNINHIKVLDGQKKELVIHLTNIEQWISLSTELNNHILFINQSFNNSLRLKLNQEIDREVREIDEKGALLNKQFFDNKSISNTINELEKMVDNLSKEVSLLKILVKALSPTEGLVAEQLSLFISTLVGNVNAILKEIWSEPIHLLPCNSEEGNLTFRFPIIFNNEGTRVDDIGEISTGESQIVDLAFRLVFMIYHGIENYPLFIDEIGANFDEANKPLLMNFIKQLSTSGKYGQIFLISHYFNQHGALPNMQVCALSTTGVTLPQVYNEHVIME